MGTLVILSIALLASTANARTLLQEEAAAAVPATWYPGQFAGQYFNPSYWTNFYSQVSPFFFRPGRAIRLVRELGEHEHRLQLARHLWPPWPPTNRIHLNPLRGLSPPPPPQFPNSRRRRRFYFFPPLF